MSKELEPVAWVRFNFRFEESPTIHLCDSDHPAAFAVCLHSQAMDRIKELEELVGTPSFEGDTPAMHLANSMQFGAEMVDKYSKLNKRIKELEAENAELRQALKEIALAGMSGTGQESEEAMTHWHARQAYSFIQTAAIALTKADAAMQKEKA